MQAKPDYDEFNPTDNEPVGMKFDKDIPDDPEIISAVVSLLVLDGVDPDPASHLDGAPVIGGKKVSQVIKNLVGGVKYRVVFVANGSITPGVTLYCDLYCRDPARADAC